MAGFNDITLGSQKIGFLSGGLKTEFCTIDVSNEVSEDNVVPSTLVNLLGWVGMADVSIGCVTLHSRAITNMSLCVGPVLEISVADISAGTLSVNAKLRYIAWGW